MKRKGITTQDLMPHLADKTSPEPAMTTTEALKRLRALRAAMMEVSPRNDAYRRDIMAMDRAIEALSGND